MEKLLSIAIPCYNSQDYMEKAITSLLDEKEDIEILLVDDGSKDNTGITGDSYASRYPGTIISLHQENGGHGEAVNTGIRYASGKYFKVLDSDDWFDKKAFKKVIEQLKTLEENKQEVDMMVVNYVYEKPSENKQSVIRYKNVFPQNRIFTWDEIGHFMPQQNLLMHSIIYRREVLVKSQLSLPKHTFYVDNLFAFLPLPYVDTMYYLDVDLYRYFIGREGQSVQEETMLKRIDQQLLVNRLMIDTMQLSLRENKKRYAYMVKYLTMISVVSTILLVRSGTKEHLKKKDELWQYLKFEKPWLYRNVNHTLLGKAIQRKTWAGRKFLSVMYDISQKIFAFN